MRLLTPRLLTAALLLFLPLPVLGQSDAPDPAETARLRIGPVSFTPRLQLTNLGVDTNVFNEWEDPDSDVTFTLGPRSDFWLRAGRARLSVKAALDYVYFATFASERSLNTAGSARLEAPLAFVRPWVGASYLNTRDRYSPELDLRARRTETGFSGGLDFPVSSRTTFGLGLKEVRTEFPGGEAVGSTYLREVFNRKTRVGTASLRFRLTPLTTLLVAAEVVRERFEFSPERDSNGFRLVPGVEFDAFALVHGEARVGYGSLRMLTPGMPDYRGPVASVDLGFRLLGVTRFEFNVRRDVEYSYDFLQPYFVLTGGTASVTQAVGGPWSVTARLGTQRLAYRAAVFGGATTPEPAEVQALAEAGRAELHRLDDVRFWGGSIGYRLGPDTTLSLDVNYYKRRSERSRLDYSGLRAGTSVTYGF